MAVTRDRYNRSRPTDDRGRLDAVSRRIRAGYLGHLARRQSGRRYDAYRRRQKYIIYVTRVGSRWIDRGRSAINRITGRFIGPLYDIWDIMRGIGEPTAPGRGIDRISYARIGVKYGVHYVFKPVANDAAIRPDRDRRVLYHIKPGYYVSSDNTVAGPVDRRTNADCVINGYVTP